MSDRDGSQSRPSQCVDATIDSSSLQLQNTDRQSTLSGKRCALRTTVSKRLTFVRSLRCSEQIGHRIRPETEKSEKPYAYVSRSRREQRKVSDVCRRSYKEGTDHKAGSINSTGFFKVQEHIALKNTNLTVIT